MSKDAAAPKERRVPHACEASSASRTNRSVDSAARRAGPEPAGLWPAASCDIPTRIAAAPLERRVPHACEASSASRTIRSVDSAARRAGPEPAGRWPAASCDIPA
jgi:hypothetical protein